MNIRAYLKEHILLFDGAMGTYFSSVYEDPQYKCEYANITSPNTVKEIHKRYLQAGAKAIKTNTFAAYGGRKFSCEDIITNGFRIASEVAKDYDALVFCDIGPIKVSGDENVFGAYKKLIDAFLAEGGINFLF